MNNLPPANSPNLDSQRWQRIEEIFQQANSLPPQTRAEFLMQACGADEVLRHEVESLLEVQPEAEAYFESPTKLEVDVGETAKSSFLSLQQESVAPSATKNSTFHNFALVGVIVVAILHLLLGWLSLKYCCTDKVFFLWQYRDQAVILQSPLEKRLLPGDQLIAINGNRNFIPMEWYIVRRRIPSGDPLRLLVHRDGIERLVEIPNNRLPGIRASKLQYSLLGIPRGAIFLAVALILVLIKRNDRFSRVACLAFIAMSVMNLRQIIIPIRGDLSLGEQWIESLVLLLNGGDFFIPLSFILCLLFPPDAKLPPRRFWAALSYLLFSVSMLLALNRLLVVFSYQSVPVTDWLFAHGYARWYHFYKTAEELYFVLGLGCVCVVLLRNFIVVQNTVLRRRIKVVIYGSVASVLPIVSLTLTEQLVKQLELDGLTWRSIYSVMLWVANGSSLIFPLTWAYAILTQRIYDVRVVIRRGLQYLLARNVLRIALALPIFLAIWQIASQPDQTIRQLIIGQPLTLVLIALAALSLAFRQQLSRWLDQHFFREQYQQEQVLYRLIDEIGEYDNLRALCMRVEHVLVETLHPQRVSFFLRQAPTRALQLIQTASSPAENNASLESLSEASELYQLLKTANEPLAFPLPRGTALPSKDQHFLAFWQAHLLVPMHDSQAQLAGLLLLGEKRSEEPYSPTDRRLLAALAHQMASVVEVAQLRGQVVQKAQTEHTVLARLAADEVNLLRECPQCGACYGVETKQCANCTTPLALTIPIERIIEGRYQLEQLIGKGGMGVVYRAYDQRLRRAVAVKILKAEYFGESALLRRFEKEALAIARLDHPNIVRVFDSGTTPAGGAWLVMELLNGISLRDALQSHGRFSLPATAHWFEQLLDAMQVAHQAGVIHRDLKPENILLLTEKLESEIEPGQLKILDFGLAKLHIARAESQAISAVTVQGMLIGTLAYMSPEQLEGQEVDERSDIYSLTIMLLEFLTGIRPTPQARTANDCENLLRSIDPTYCALLPLLRKGLSVDIQHRYNTIKELRSDFISLVAYIAARENQNRL